MTIPVIYLIAIKIETKILICIFANREEDDYEVTLDDITFSDDEVEPDPTPDNYAEIDFSSFDTFQTPPQAPSVPDTTTMTTRSRRVKKEKNEKKEKKVKKEPKLVKPKLEKKKVKLLVFIFFLNLKLNT